MATLIQLAGIGEVEKIKKHEPPLDVKMAVFNIPADAPFFDGHFPGQPVVPGIILLDWVASVLGKPIDTLDDVRFIIPVIPGDHRAVEISYGEDRKFAFLIRSDDEFAARGRGRWLE